MEIVFHRTETGKGETVVNHIFFKQEGHDGPVSLHRPICKILSYQTLQYLGIGLKQHP